MSRAQMLKRQQRLAQQERLLQEQRRASPGQSVNVPGQPAMPLQRSQTIVDPRAAAALQENIDNARNPSRRHVGNTGKANSWVDTYTNKTAGVQTQIKNTPNARRGRQLDVGFSDTQATGYEQRPNRGTPYERQLRSNTVKDQISRGLEAQRPGGLQSGDRVTANPTSAGRARLYKGFSTAFEATPDRVGDLAIDSKVNRDGTITTRSGKKVPMPKIKGLRAGLSQMAVRNVMATVGGPPMQALLRADQILKEATGKGIFDRQHEGLVQSIEGQQKAGNRFFNPAGNLPF